MHPATSSAAYRPANGDTLKRVATIDTCALPDNCERRVYGPENFWSPVQKDFCNNICH
jgi:hypothetical protein